jgi:antitoxin VapB
MERAGIDIITDGEIRRESYSNRFATALSGVDLDGAQAGARMIAAPDAARTRETDVTCLRTKPIYIFDGYRMWGDSMSDTGIAKIFMHGRSQAVRLPLRFRLPGDRVRVRRVESGILLEPMVTDIDAWFAELDRFADVPFMEEGPASSR